MLGGVRSGQPDSSQPCPQIGAVGMGAGVVGEESQAVPQRGGLPQVQPGQGQPGRGEVDVAVDEGRCDEGTVEIDDRRVGKLSAPDVVAAEPCDDAVAHRHGGGVGHGRAVHPAVQQKCRHLVGFALHGRRFDVDHVDPSTTRRRCSHRAARCSRQHPRR